MTELEQRLRRIAATLVAAADALAELGDDNADTTRRHERWTPDRAALVLELGDGELGADAVAERFAVTERQARRMIARARAGQLNGEGAS